MIVTKRYLGILGIAITMLVTGLNFSNAAPPKNAPANNAAAVFNRAKDAFYNYDFNTAASLFRQYKNMSNSNSNENWEDMAATAASAFERVQQIVVIDSINMPRASFFKALRLPSSAGKVGTPSDLGLSKVVDNDEVAFLNEARDYAITPLVNQTGSLTLIEQRKLLDGTWESMPALNGDYEEDSDYAFPFLSGDGQTLYFANNGIGTMGGFDLFVVQKEPITGDCLQPLNLGMPFNSPYDDLMIAVDEENGIGWWATDRNSPGEDITIYVYILDDIRKNYPGDTENLKELAKMSNYKATWEDGQENDYKSILKSLPK